MSLKQRKVTESDFVFHREGGSRWKNARPLQKGFGENVTAAGLQSEHRRGNVTIHTLRHTFGSLLALAGVPMRKIQALMGHKSITTTEGYSHSPKEETHADTRALEKLTAGFLPESLPEGFEEKTVTDRMRKGGLEPPRREPLDPKTYLCDCCPLRNLIKPPKIEPDNTR
jgi:hypothetical protein